MRQQRRHNGLKYTRIHLGHVSQFECMNIVAAFEQGYQRLSTHSCCRVQLQLEELQVVAWTLERANAVAGDLGTIAYGQ